MNRTCVGCLQNRSHSAQINVFFSSLSFSSSYLAEPLPLMDLCRRAARLALGRDRLQQIETLPLPQSLKNYLQYQWCGQIRARHTLTHKAQGSRCDDSSANNGPNVYTTICGYYQRCSFSSFIVFFFFIVCRKGLCSWSVRMPQRTLY